MILSIINDALASSAKISNLKDPTQAELAKLVSGAVDLPEEAWRALPGEAQEWLDRAVRRINKGQKIALPPEAVHLPEVSQKEEDMKKKDKSAPTKGAKKSAPTKGAKKSAPTKGAKKSAKASKAPKASKAIKEPKEPKASKAPKEPKVPKEPKEPKEPKVATPRTAKKGTSYYAVKFFMQNPDASIDAIIEASKESGSAISKGTLQVLLSDVKLALRVQEELSAQV